MRPAMAWGGRGVMDDDESVNSEPRISARLVADAMSDGERPDEADGQIIPLSPLPEDSAKWLVLRSDQRVVLYDPANLSMTVHTARGGLRLAGGRMPPLPELGRRGRNASSRRTVPADTSLFPEAADEDEAMPDRASSLVRAHVAPQTRGRCALCNQLLPDGQRSPVTEVEDLTNFVDQRYFQMLATTSFTDVNPRLPAAGGPEASPPRPGRSRTRSTGSQMNGDAEQLSSKSFNDGYYERFFIEVAKLGRGYRGSVFLCQHLLDGIALSEYAIKKIPVGESHTWLVRMLKEVRLLERLQHPNVVDFKHVWLEHHSPTIYGPPVPTLFVLMNLANGGNLEDFICVQHDPTGPTGGPLTAKEILRLRQQNQAAVNVHKITFSGEWQATGGSSAGSGARTKRFPNPAELRGGIGWAVNADGSFVVPSRKVRYLTQEQIWSFFLDITRGLAHLHRNRIVHRDLKPPNLLLQFADVSQKNVDPCPRVLISDFGECEILSEQEQTRRRSGATGTLEFTAPELLSGDGEGTVEEGIAADLWALGMILFFCCYSRLPWSQVDDVDLLKSEILAAGGGIRLPEPPDDADEGSARVSRELRGLMELLLDADGNRRPSAQSILDRFDAGSSSWHRAPRSPVEDNV